MIESWSIKSYGRHWWGRNAEYVGEKIGETCEETGGGVACH